MVEVEFAGIALEQMDAVRLVASGVRQALDRRIAGSGRPMLDARRVSPLVFELLSVLFDLDPEQAHRWATRCLFDKVGFSALRSVNDTPVPIELYLVLPMPAFAEPRREIVSSLRFSTGVSKMRASPERSLSVWNFCRAFCKARDWEIPKARFHGKLTCFIDWQCMRTEMAVRCPRLWM